MIFHLPLTHIQKYIIKEQICYKQTIFKTRLAKYPKNLFKSALKDNSSHRTIQIIRDNSLHSHTPD
jgi:hypothetical protein